MKGNISTRTGDKGTTGVGGGGRVPKNDIRIQSLGDLDEANSFIGLLRTKLPKDHDWQKPLQQIQTEMMNLMGYVATPSTSKHQPSVPLPEEASLRMEAWMEVIEASLSSTTEYFLLPGGTEIAALCHVVRTVSRRAERSLVALNQEDPIHPSILQFINRLSDLMFKLARQETHRSGATEDRWRLFKPEREKQ
ncbi:MAG: cob(I)yrinic acid a,c-diamide adenosyltransferase [Verrucomicrobiae bacterium]|nr:cob(I)yrinic acid a,c-diamide adenosyltransferase [Verrucomicrobiae bacterium]